MSIGKFSMRDVQTDLIITPKDTPREIVIRETEAYSILKCPNSGKACVLAVPVAISVSEAESMLAANCGKGAA